MLLFAEMEGCWEQITDGEQWRIGKCMICEHFDYLLLKSQNTIVAIQLQSQITNYLPPLFIAFVNGKYEYSTICPELWLVYKSFIFALS